MNILPAIPVLLLGVFAAWFFWPTFFDLIARDRSSTREVDDNDRLAEHLFERWRDGTPLAQPDRS